MKILYASHTYTVRANQAKIAALARLPGVEIALVTPHAWRGPLYKNRTDLFDSHNFPNVRHYVLRSAFIGKESAYVFHPSIFSIIKKFQPDIVHVEQGSYAISYAQILWGLQRYAANSRAIFFTWWNLPYELLGLKQKLENFNFQHSAAAVAGNLKAKLILEQRGFARPVHVLPQLGIDIPSSIIPKSSNGTFRIGYAGRISEEKGVLDLVSAAAKMEHRERSELYFVGAGGELERVKQDARANNLRFVHHDAVRNELLPEHLSKMDVLVLPSRSTKAWVEQFGHILLEAMAAGVPVIGSSSGEIPNVIGNAGIIFREGDTAELAGALDRLCSHPEERIGFSERGAKRIEEHYTHDRIARKQKEIYDWMMAEGIPVGKSQNKTHS